MTDQLPSMPDDGALLARIVRAQHALEAELTTRLTARIDRRIAGKTRACISCLKITRDGMMICPRCQRRKRFPAAVLQLARSADAAIRLKR